MLKYFSGYKLDEYLEEKGLEDQYDSIVNNLKNNNSFRVSNEDEVFFYRENHVNFENIDQLKELIKNNNETIEDYFESYFSGDEYEQITLGKNLHLDLSGHAESAAITLSDDKVEIEAFESEDFFSYIKETLYFSRSMEIASEVEEVIYSLRNSPYKIIDWDIIINALPREIVYRLRIFEVFNEKGESMGLFENHNKEMALSWAYNSYYPENKVLFSSDLESTKWTAKEVTVYGYLPNREYEVKK